MLLHCNICTTLVRKTLYMGNDINLLIDEFNVFDNHQYFFFFQMFMLSVTNATEKYCAHCKT